MWSTNRLFSSAGISGGGAGGVGTGSDVFLAGAAAGLESAGKRRRALSRESASLRPAFLRSRAARARVTTEKNSTQFVAWYMRVPHRYQIKWTPHFSLPDWE